MFKLNIARLAVYTTAVIILSLFFFAIVIMDDPPAFFGYVFGIITGTAWSALLVLYTIYWEDCHDSE